MHRAIQLPPGNSSGPAKIRAACGLDPLRSRVDIVNVEVINPERDLLFRRLIANVTDRLPAAGEQLIRVRRTDLGVRFLPAKKFAVENKCPFTIDGQQLMPSHTSQLAEVGRLLAAALTP